MLEFLIGLILCRFCLSNHSCYEFMCAAAAVSSREQLFHSTSLFSSVLSILFASSSTMVSESWLRNWGVGLINMRSGGSSERMCRELMMS